MATLLKTALQFSGGKDSLACLHLYEKQWDSILVAFLDSGAHYEETLEYMERWKNRLPNFLVVKSDQPTQIQRYGHPVDVLPIRALGLDDKVIHLQASLSCCAQNRWIPMQQKMLELGITTIIRGTRVDEKRLSPIRSGYIDGFGIKYIHPIEGWTEEMVWNYLKSINADIPSYYEIEEASRNCWNCTAYLDENVKRIQNLEPQRKAYMIRVLKEIDSLIQRENLIPQIIGEI